MASITSSTIGRQVIAGAVIAGLLIILLAINAKGSAMTLDSKRSLAEAVQDLSTAVAQFETGLVEKPFPLDATRWEGRARSNKNPGNLRYIGQAGAIGQDAAGYARFPDESTGWFALQRDVRGKMTGRTVTGLNPKSTLRQFILTWAPPEENESTRPNGGNYLSFVAAQLGVDPDAPFTTWATYPEKP